jgi:electron transport complex protein RnfD
MEQKLVIMSSPHLRAKKTTRGIMLDVLIALTPALIAAIVIFGLRALLLSLFCIGSCMLLEFSYRLITKQSNTVFDFSAAVTGLLLSFSLPVTLPFWMAFIGCFAAIVVVKQLFGGIGRNFANPAIVGRIVLLVSFAGPMTHWVAPAVAGVDALSSATPLMSGAASASTIDLFLGVIGGSMGETCKLALLLGFIYLVCRKVITVTTPLVYMGTVMLSSLILGADPVYQLLSGGLILGAAFMPPTILLPPSRNVEKRFSRWAAA